MSRVVCLQGGREFTANCLEMDREVMHRSNASLVAVIAGAARVGDDYAGASERARRYYAGLGTQVRIISDPRTDPDAALAALDDEIDLIVLPGGSPSGLLGVLSGAVRSRLIDLHDSGTSISGASAGAMVLCASMARPDRGGDTVDGLGIVEGLALPHWSPERKPWDVPDVTLWGLPECGGVIFDGSDPIAVGQGDPSVRRAGRWSRIPR